MASKKSLYKKLDLVVTSCLGRITDFQLQSNLDAELFNEIEELREYLVKYLENKKPSKK